MKTDALTEALKSVLAWLGPQLVRSADIERVGKRLSHLETLVDALEAVVGQTPKPTRID